MDINDKCCRCSPPIHKYTEMSDAYSDKIVAMPLNALNDASYIGDVRSLLCEMLLSVDAYPTLVRQGLDRHLLQSESVEVLPLMSHVFACRVTDMLEVAHVHKVTTPGCMSLAS